MNIPATDITNLIGSLSAIDKIKDVRVIKHRVAILLKYFKSAYESDAKVYAVLEAKPFATADVSGINPDAANQQS